MKFRFRPRYNRIFYRKHHLKGTGMGSVLLDGGMGGQNSYYSVQDYERTTTKGKGLGSKLEHLVIKQPTIKKPKNIMLNF